MAPAKKTTKAPNNAAAGHDASRHRQLETFSGFAPTPTSSSASALAPTTSTSRLGSAPRPKPARTDMILAMNDPYMQQIIDGTKTYEFRKYNMAGIQRIWFYRTAPHSAITHICPVNEAATRNPGDEPLPEDGLGNKDYNEGHPDYEGYDYAYRINAVYEIDAEGGRGITWAMMRDEHGMKIAPRGRVTVPESMLAQYQLQDQPKIL